MPIFKIYYIFETDHITKKKKNLIIELGNLSMVDIIGKY